jgi:hypothetical protein
MVLPHHYHLAPLFTEGLPKIPVGFWFGLFLTAMSIAQGLLCLLQVLQYRSWCQELEKHLEATGVSEIEFHAPLSQASYAACMRLECDMGLLVEAFSIFHP